MFGPLSLRASISNRLLFFFIKYAMDIMIASKMGTQVTTQTIAIIPSELPELPELPLEPPELPELSELCELFGGSVLYGYSGLSASPGYVL